MTEPKYLRPFVTDATGKRLPLLFPIGPRAQRIAGLSLIASDLKRCHRGFSYIVENHPRFRSKGEFIGMGELNADEFAARSIWISTVVTYGKCFVDAEGRRLKLERKTVKALGPSLLECHDKPMSERHEYAAHGGDSLHEAARFGIAVSNLDPLELVHVAFDLQAWLPGKDQSAMAIDLCRQLQIEVAKRVEVACASFEADVRKMPLDELRRLIESSRRAHSGFSSSDV